MLATHWLPAKQTLSSHSMPAVVRATLQGLLILQGLGVPSDKLTATESDPASQLPRFTLH